MFWPMMLRSIVINSRDEVAPSWVNGAACLPTVTANCVLWFHCTYASVNRM